MRALVLLVAVMLSAGSAKNASGRYSQRSALCGNDSACQHQATARYAVESQQQMLDQQRTLDAQQRQEEGLAQLTGRCERIAQRLLICQVIAPADTVTTRDYCVFALGGSAPAETYGMALCYEAAADCDGVRWCQAH
jgi:hypothetical protein